VSEAGEVILVDDDTQVRKAGAQTLELAGLKVTCFASAEGVAESLTRAWPGVVVTDVRMPGTDGLGLLRRLHTLDPDLPVVIVTGHGDVPMAVQAMRDGAYDFIEKPFAADLLVNVVQRGLEKRRLVLENRDLRALLEGSQAIESLLVGRTPAMVRLRRTVLALADTDADVLLHGETGSGKEVVAHALHRFGRRAEQPFVAINCGALPATIIESELFGHEPGAFTGAQGRRIGKFEHASGGTLFLDEIESMPLELQVRLLRVLQERSLERLGSNRPVPLDLRVIAATKVDLREASAQGRFREDLYYRLAVVPLQLPPLRERLADVPLLFQHFLLQAARRLGREPPEVEAEMTAGLLAHDWPGNVRELRNAAERFALGLELAEITAAGEVEGGVKLAERVEAFEKSLLVQALTRHGGDVRAICEALGLPRKTFYDKLQKHRLRRGDFAGQEASPSAD